MVQRGGQHFKSLSTKVTNLVAVHRTHARHAAIARRAILSRRNVSDFQKLTCLRPQISGFIRVVPPRQEGRIAIVTKRGVGCDGRDGVEKTSDAGTDGEVVWS
jgi:hypothetical protein